MNMKKIWCKVDIEIFETRTLSSDKFNEFEKKKSLQKIISGYNENSQGMVLSNKKRVKCSKRTK